MAHTRVCKPARATSIFDQSCPECTLQQPLNRTAQQVTSQLHRPQQGPQKRTKGQTQGPPHRFCLLGRTPFKADGAAVAAAEASTRTFQGASHGGNPKFPLERVLLSRFRTVSDCPHCLCWVSCGRWDKHAPRAALARPAAQPPAAVRSAGSAPTWPPLILVQGSRPTKTTR